jgi:cell division protein FtsI (penicillin-binding protein 3)
MKTNRKQEVSPSTQRRMTVVYLLMVLLGLACLVKILYLSIAERAVASGSPDKCVNLIGLSSEKVKDLKAENHYCYVDENMLRPMRGEIYDDHGRVLVANFTVFEVAFDGNGFLKQYADTLKKNPNAFDNLFQRVAQDFYGQFKDRFPKFDAEYYFKLFKRTLAKEEGKRYSTIFSVKEWDDRSWVTGVDTAFIKNLPYLYKYEELENGDSVRKRKVNMHFNFIPTNVRVNPYGEMAKRTLGAQTPAHQYGLEHSMNDILGGQEGSKKYLLINHAKVPLRDRIEPDDGYNIHTTLKLEIQHAVHNELSRKLSELGAEWGCAIVMETKTGEIKAISNLRRSANDPTYYNESMEYALNAKVEPGSTFKLASLLAYLEKVPNDTVGRYRIYQNTFEFPTKSGQIKRYTKTDHEYTPIEVSALEVFKRSSNVGIAKMVFDTYGKRGFPAYIEQLKKFGLLDTVHSQLGDLLPARIRDGSNDFNTYYATTFGAGFNIPIIRTLIYYNAIANDGKMMAPLFVRYVTNTYDTIQRFEPQVLMDSIASASTVKKARYYLEQVVWGEHGTAYRYRDENCMFAGKTGTRDIWDESMHCYRKDINAVSFCGYFPMDHPQYTVIVYIYGVPQMSSVAVDAFARIARSIMNSANYSATRKASDSPFTPLGRTAPIQKKYFNTLLAGLGYDTVSYETDANYVRVDQTDTNRHVTAKALPLGQYQKMPDVRGMLASDAVTELIRAGYKVNISGRGRVKSQILDDKTHTVKLYLDP